MLASPPCLGPKALSDAFSKENTKISHVDQCEECNQEWEVLSTLSSLARSMKVDSPSFAEHQERQKSLLTVAKTLPQSQKYETIFFRKASLLIAGFLLVFVLPWFLSNKEGGLFFTHPSEREAKIEPPALDSGSKENLVIVPVEKEFVSTNFPKKQQTNKVKPPPSSSAVPNAFSSSLPMNEKQMLKENTRENTSRLFARSPRFAWLGEQAKRDRKTQKPSDGSENSLRETEDFSIELEGTFPVESVAVVNFAEFSGLGPIGGKKNAPKRNSGTKSPANPGTPTPEAPSVPPGECGLLELHVISVYEGANNNTSTHSPGEIFVEFDRVGTHVLVLSSYEPNHWTVSSGPYTEIQTIILNGYHEQTVEAPPGTEIFSFTGPGASISSCHSAQTNSDCNYETFISSLTTMTGLPVASFAGCYDGMHFGLSRSATTWDVICENEYSGESIMSAECSSLYQVCSGFSGTGRYEMRFCDYEADPSVITEDTPCEAAVQNCRLNSANNPDYSVNCVWNDLLVFESQPAENACEP